jgi:hypothetical protein
MIESLQSIFDGLMLGDGGLTKPNKNALYQQSCKRFNGILWCWIC